VVDGALRWAAIAATLFLVTGFVMFAGDEMSHASAQQVTYLSSTDSGQERAREAHHSSVREAIDDVDDVLLRPFTGVANSSNHWVRQGIPTLLALLIYGFGLGFLARYVRVRS
jgi:hypothetical protein